ncbi:MAG: putative toxin-antitoxin system toxin component, PIN family [Nitrospirae bacterium]|nr:putative toxin-antitoxin system toxin component, PIN family [Nitrospirota bacterium]
MRAVIDTNIFIAGLLNLEGGAAKIINHFKDNIFELVITHEVFDEYLRVIHLFDNDIPPNKSEELLELIFEKAVKLESSSPEGICKDPDDEKFLSAAISGKAKYIVTKNKKDFPHNLSAVKIANVREFLNKLEG